MLLKIKVTVRKLIPHVGSYPVVHLLLFKSSMHQHCKVLMLARILKTLRRLFQGGNLQVGSKKGSGRTQQPDIKWSEL